MSARVFLLAQPTVARDGSFPDLTPLAVHGEVVIIVEAGERPSFSPQESFDRILKKLGDFDAETDAVAWAGGDTLSALLAGAALFSLGHRTFTWLRFERGRKDGKRVNHTGHYTPVQVSAFPLDVKGNHHAFVK